MAEVVLFIDDFGSDPAIRHCRICHEEEFESCNNMEAPCACSGTVKFAHRDCIQRWCNEKGNTTCEICLQEYKPGYTAPSKKKPAPVETTVTIRDSLQVPRSEVELQNERFMAAAERLMTGNQFSDQCASPGDGGASRLRSFALTLTVILILKHFFEVLMGGAEDYPFSLLTILMLRACGIILPMYILVSTITALQNSIKRQYHGSDDYTSNTNQGEDEVEQQRHHTL